MTFPTRLAAALFVVVFTISCGEDGTSQFSEDKDIKAQPPKDTGGPGDPDLAPQDLWQPPPDTAEPSPLLAKLETHLLPESILAGGTAAASCKGLDANGTPVDTGPVTLIVPEGVGHANFQVSANKVGSYEIKCHASKVPGAEVVPATLTVTAGPPLNFQIALKPVKDYYGIGDKVTVTAAGEDSYGNSIDEVELGPITISPPSMGKVKDNKVEFLTEGKGIIEASAAKTPSLSDGASVAVDEYPPIIEIFTPARAAALLGAGSVQVEGRITDSAGIDSAHFGGSPLTLDNAGGFTSSISPKIGLNLIEVTATDGAERESRHLQSFLFSSKYYPTPKLPLEKLLVPNGVAAWIDYDAFVGPNDENGPSFSYLAQEFLVDIDVESLLPNPVASQTILLCTYDIFLTNITYGEITIEVTPTPSGLMVHVKIPNLEADLDAPAPWCPDVSGHVSATALTFDALASVDISSGELDVTLGDVNAEFVGLVIDLYGFTGNIVQAFISFFQDSLTEMIETQFEEQVTYQFEAQLGTMLGNISIEQWLDIPPFMPGSPPSEVEVHIHPSGLETGYAGVTAYMDGAFTALDKKGSSLPGSITRSGCLKGDFATTKVEGLHVLEIALHHDLLNQVLYSVWLDGGIDMELDAETMAAMGQDPSEMGVENITITTDALLPPVIHDCSADKAFRIEMGEMKMDLSMEIMGMPLDMIMYMYFSAVAQMDITGEPGNQIVYFTYDQLDWMDLHIESVNEEWKGKESVFAELIQQTFLPEFLKMMQEYPYAIPVSQLPLEELMPSFAMDWTFVPVIDSIVRQKGQTFIKAHLLID